MKITRPKLDIMPTKWGLILVIAALSSGCAVNRSIQYEHEEIVRAETEIPDAARLDVGIMLFDPGVPEDIEDREKDLVFKEVREAEARYMPFHLKSTLEASGHWGSVWVVPESDAAEAVDLFVWGRIDKSNGLTVELQVGAWDATGREWLNNKYKTDVPDSRYGEILDQSQDAYQTIYNQIANDLLAMRESLDQTSLTRIRDVSNMRYAASLVPAYETYIEADKNGQYTLKRLPAEDDPMMARLQQVREREYLLMDTVNEYYAGLYYELGDPYEDWRQEAQQEMKHFQAQRRAARMRTLMGLAAIVGAVAYEGGGGSNSAISTAAIIGGIEGIKSGLGKYSQAGIHKDAIRELGGSFGAEAEPLVVEVEGQTRRLTGSAEEQYKEWRRLLREIYTRETGLSYELAAGSAGGASPDQVSPN